MTGTNVSQMSKVVKPYVHENEVMLLLVACLSLDVAQRMLPSRRAALQLWCWGTWPSVTLSIMHHIHDNKRGGRASPSSSTGIWGLHSLRTALGGFQLSSAFAWMLQGKRGKKYTYIFIYFLTVLALFFWHKNINVIGFNLSVKTEPLFRCEANTHRKKKDFNYYVTHICTFLTFIDLSFIYRARFCSEWISWRPWAQPIRRLGGIFYVPSVENRKCRPVPLTLTDPVVFYFLLSKKYLCRSNSE